MGKHDYANLTNAEITDKAQDNRVIVLALGTVESNGPHQLVGIDYLLADAVAAESCRRSTALRLPAIPYGVSFSQEGIPGTISVTAEQLTSMVSAVVDGVVKEGFERILLINCHRGNNGAIEDLARQYRREGKAVIAQIDPIDLGKAGPFKGASAKAMGHGGDPGMSLMMYLHPNDVRMDLAPPDGLRQVGGMQALSSQQIAFEGAKVRFFMTSAELNPAGAWADISEASSEKGQQAFDWIVDYTVKFIDWFQRTPIAELNPAMDK